MHTHTVFDGIDPLRLTMPDILRWRALHEPLREAYTFLHDGPRDTQRDDLKK